MEVRNQTIKKEQKEKAYMTVEASLIYPLIFGGILFTICLALYLYHASVVKQVTSVAALRGSLEWELSEKEIQNFVNTEIDTLRSERLLFVAKIEKEIEVTESKVGVRLKAKVKLPFIKIPFLDFQWKELDFESQAKRINPVKIIRNTRRLYGG